MNNMKVYERISDGEKVIVASREEAEKILKTTELKYFGLEKELRGQARFRTSKGLFRFYQPNKKDLKNEHGDCVIRALCKVLRKSWLTVFDETIPIARKMQCPINWKDCYHEYLESQGYEWHPVIVTKGSKRPTVKSFTQEHPKGRYFLSVAHHVVASVNGLYFDTWDSGNHSLYGWYEKKTFKLE